MLDPILAGTVLEGPAPQILHPKPCTSGWAGQGVQGALPSLSLCVPQGLGGGGGLGCPGTLPAPPAGAAEPSSVRIFVCCSVFSLSSSFLLGMICPSLFFFSSLFLSF